jgi:uncharacterized alkaline shock family protein YloU
MNVVNRIIMIVASLLVFAFGTVVFLLLTNIIIPSNTYLRGILGLYSAWQSVALIKGMSANGLIIIALIVGLIGLIFLILELLPFRRVFGRRREGRKYVVHQDPLGVVSVARSMVTNLVQHEAAGVPGVTQVVEDPQVKDSPSGLRVSTRAAISWDANAPGVGQMLQERIKDSIQTHLGLSVAEVTVATQAAPEVKTSGRRVE